MMSQDTRKETTMIYHVTQEWDGKDLQTAAQRMGEQDAIEMFCAKWDADSSFAADQVTKIFFYSTIEEAQEHQDVYGGEILEIDDTWIETFEDWTEGVAILATRQTVKAQFIRRI